MSQNNRGLLKNIAIVIGVMAVVTACVVGYIVIEEPYTDTTDPTVSVVKIATEDSVEVDVRVTAMNGASEVSIQGSDATVVENGGSMTTVVESGSTITITAEVDGETRVIQEFTA